MFPMWDKFVPYEVVCRVHNWKMLMWNEMAYNSAQMLVVVVVVLKERQVS